MNNDKDNKKKKLPMASSLHRRDFLRALGISGVATAAACERLPVRKALPYVEAPDEIVPGVPVHYASTCSGCSAACGMMVTVRDGRPVKLEGSDKHPVSKGGLCAMGQAELRGLYDAGRLTEPTIGGQAGAWEALDGKVKAAVAGLGGKTVEVLSTPIVSPTGRRVIETFFKGASGTLTEFSPTPRTRAFGQEAYAALDGKRRLPSLDIGGADILVVLGADILGTGLDPVGVTSSYAGRRSRSKRRGPLRHIQLEGSMSLTGAGADERWIVTQGERTNFALWLLKNLAEKSGNQELIAATASAPGDSGLGDRATKLADALWQARGRSLLVSDSTDLAEQVAVALANRILGNEGRTLHLANHATNQGGSQAALDALRERLKAGTVGALIVLDLDPVEQLHDGAEWKKWLGAVDLSVAVTDRPTATAAASKMVAAAHHALECWHDFQPRADVLSLAQPTIRPLYHTRHPYENFLYWASAENTNYRKNLKKSWETHVFSKVQSRMDFEGFWHASVVSGLPPAPILPEPVAEDDANKKPWATLLVPQKREGELEVEQIATIGMRDGSRTFNPWLRELPDPLTRVSWTPTIAVAPKRAKMLGVSNGDELEVSVGGASVTMPVRILPGQHINVLGVPVGFGRMDGDRAKKPRNAYLLGAGAAVAKATGSKEALPLVQEHDVLEGRPIVHQVSSYEETIPSHLPKYLDSDPRGVHRESEADKIGGKHEYATSWHMTINLDACTGCSSCIVACQAENNTPVVGPVEVERNRDMYWLRMDRYFVGEEDDPEVVFSPTLCQHCDHAPCETVCPAAATLHSHDGLNMQAYNRCVGTRYCANNCPYKVRRFNWFQYEHGEPVERMVLNPDVVVRERGVMEKCSFCVQRIQLARIEARNRGDKTLPEVRTACQQSCPADAIHFGDAKNPRSVVSRDRKDPRAYQVLEDLGTEPSITYLARVRSRQS